MSKISDDFEKQVGATPKAPEHTEDVGGIREISEEMLSLISGGSDSGDSSDGDGGDGFDGIGDFIETFQPFFDGAPFSENPFGEQFTEAPHPH